MARIGLRFRVFQTATFIENANAEESLVDECWKVQRGKNGEKKRRNYSSDVHLGTILLNLILFEGSKQATKRKNLNSFGDNVKGEKMISHPQFVYTLKTMILFMFISHFHSPLFFFWQ